MVLIKKVEHEEGARLISVHLIRSSGVCLTCLDSSDQKGGAGTQTTRPLHLKTALFVTLNGFFSEILGQGHLIGALSEKCKLYVSEDTEHQVMAVLVVEPDTPHEHCLYTVREIMWAFVSMYREQLLDWTGVVSDFWPFNGVLAKYFAREFWAGLEETIQVAPHGPRCVM